MVKISKTPSVTGALDGCPDAHKPTKTRRTGGKTGSKPARDEKEVGAKPGQVPGPFIPELRPPVDPRLNQAVADATAVVVTPRQPATQKFKVVSAEKDVPMGLTRAFSSDELVPTSLQDMVQMLTARSRPGGISELWIINHAASGWLSISNANSLYLEFDPKTGKGFIADNRDDGKSCEDELRKLRPLFAPNAVVKIEACSLGAGEVGRNFLSRMATVLGATVIAGDAIQRPYLPGLEGRVIIAHKDGSVEVHEPTSLARAFQGFFNWVDGSKDPNENVEKGDELARQAVMCHGGPKGAAASLWFKAAQAYYHNDPSHVAYAHARGLRELLAGVERLEDLSTDLRNLATGLGSGLASSGFLGVDGVAFFTQVWPKEVSPRSRLMALEYLRQCYAARSWTVGERACADEIARSRPGKVHR